MCMCKSLGEEINTSNTGPNDVLMYNPCLIYSLQQFLWAEEGFLYSVTCCLFIFSLVSVWD